ncbi:MAG: alpha/beta hydrolase [Pyrinomonadaceae bacterium]|nr:alpha/beta hydrolase [Pyrinomonadaceae bacterium]
MHPEIENMLGSHADFVQVDGRKLAYSEIRPPESKGTVLLLTGLSSKRFGWYKQFREFGKHYHTIALDNRDAGDSDLTTAPYTVADQADDAAAILRTLKVEKANVIGISMGGFMSLELTLRHPELVQKLVLVATSAGGKSSARPHLNLIPFFLLLPLFGRNDAGTRAEMVYKRIMAPDFLGANREESDIIKEIARYKPMSRAAYNRPLRACQLHDAAARLDRINKPTLVIHGESDPLVPAANGRNLAKNIKNARLIIYEKTGHIPIIERAADFNRDVLNFLDEN